MRKRLAVALCALAALGLTGGSAFGGEVTGTGQYIAGSDSAPLNGKSDCAYSGLNDDYYVGGDTSARRTQNWGEFATAGVHMGVPGVACNPSGARA
jgi:hypothetical protein